MGNPKLGDTLANGLGITGITELETPDADQDPGSRSTIPQPRKPLGIVPSLANLPHLATVSRRILLGKYGGEVAVLPGGREVSPLQPHKGITTA